MKPFIFWMSLGLCPITSMGIDDELTMRTCQAVFDAKHRLIVVKDDGWTEKKRKQFYDDVAGLVYP